MPALSSATGGCKHEHSVPVVLNAILENQLMRVVSRFYTSAISVLRRRYIWLDSTQFLIGNRRSWGKTGNLPKYMHRLIEKLACVLDVEFMTWRKNIRENNAKLYREGQTTRWKRYCRANLDECLVNSSYHQFLELKQDEDYAEYLSGSKKMSDSLRTSRGKLVSARDEYQHEFDKHIEYIDNKERYESVLEWGYRSNTNPLKAATVCEEKSLSFPEDFHIPIAGGRIFNLGHIYSFLAEKFPERHVA